jgi:hypothetical protein
MISEYFPKRKDLKLTPKLMEMGFTKAYSIGKLLVLSSSAEGQEIRCKFDNKDILRTTEKYLKTKLEKSNFSNSEVDIICTQICEVLLDSIKKEYEQTQNEKRKEQENTEKILNEIKQLRELNSNLTFEQWQIKLREKYQNLKVVLSKMPEIWPGLEFELSVMQILKIQGNTLPFIGIILGRPSSYKTVIIELLKGYPNTFYTDYFTAKSFVSHSTAVDSVEELEQIDMIPKIMNNLFLTPELSPMFSAKEEDLHQILGIMTRLADGEGYASDSGAHGHRGYENGVMFTWIGAAVDVPYKVYKILSNLGAKIYFYRTDFKEESSQELLEYAKESHQFNIRKKQIKIVLYDYLKWLDIGYDLFKSNLEWDHERNDENALRYIVGAADLLSYLRCIAKVWESHDTQGSEYAYSVSQREVPRRAITALSNLAKGHALLKGRNYITLDDIVLPLKTAMDTAQIERVSMFSLLLAYGGVLNSEQVMNSLNISRPTALRTMAEFKAIGLVVGEDYHEPGQNNLSKRIVLNPRFNWFLTDPMIKKIFPHIPHNIHNFDEGNGHGKKEDLFWMVYDELEAGELGNAENFMEIDKNTVNGDKLYDMLLSTGEFHNGDIDTMITQMLKAGRLEKVMLNTYRKSHPARDRK